jgi:hypothetical protein
MNYKAIAALSAAGLLGGCAVVETPGRIGSAIIDALDPDEPVYESREYVVAADMPRPIVERRLVAPRYSDPVWVSGYWGWSGYRWVWIPGRWVNRPRAGAQWVSSRYYVVGGRRYWRSGYWH